MAAVSIRRIGRYRVYGELASGGMATVHVGRLVGAVGFSRTVAIKCPHPHLAKDPAFAAMFIDEARLASRVVHPNVVPVLDVVSVREEVYLVMEYVHGETLARLLAGARERGERMPPAVASAIVAGVLHGLHAAHEAKSERGEPLDIIHRDVSPQNVMVGADGVARVLDFGVAKAAERLLETTRDGQVKGKVAYMAPEQLRAGHVNRQTDVYSAAVVLWEALTGERLFTGASGGEVLDRVLLAEVEAPSRRALDLPSKYDAIVLRGLSRERSLRFSTAREMAVALEAVGAASTTEVSDWVGARADEVLAERARWIAELENRETTPEAPPQDVAPASGMEAAAAPPTVSVPSPPGGAATRRSYGLAAAGLLAAILLGLTLLGPWRSRPSEPLIAGTSALPPAAPGSASESPGGSTTEEQATAEPPSAASPTEPPSSAQPSGAKKPRAVPASNCNPPYTLSPTGRKTYKRNCL